MGLLSWLFGTSKPSKNAAIPFTRAAAIVPSNQEMYSHGSDYLYSSNQDILDGMEFNATLQITTPLAVLVHHGEIYNGPPSKVPQYGDSSNGIWLPKTKSWEQLAIEDSGNIELAKKMDRMQGGGTSASDIGQVAPSDYLSFLIEFRKIVESESPIKEQIKSIKALRNTSPRFASIFKKLTKSHPGFPDVFYISQLCEIPGVGIKTATAIFQAGFLSISQLKAIPLEKLMSVPGIGPNTATKILAFVSGYDGSQGPNPTAPPG